MYRIKKLTGEESNYSVLQDVLDLLKVNADRACIIEYIQDFLSYKRPINKELEELSIKARGGDDEAALQLMSKLSEMNDGL